MAASKPARKILRIAQGVFVGVVILAAVLPRSAALVERLYSNGFYRAVNAVLTPVFNTLAVPFGDVFFIALIAGFLALWIVPLVRARKGSRLRKIPRLALNSATLLAFVYLSFLLSWGLNYDREPLSSKLDYSAERITPEAARALLERDVRELNALAPIVHRAPRPTEAALRAELFTSFSALVRELGTEFRTFGPVPKRSLVEPFLEGMNVLGFTSPWTHEIILNERILDFEYPLVIAHEWSHLAGYASEAEANFIGFLACVRSGDPLIRYSAWVTLYEFLATKESAAGLPEIGDAVRADLLAVRDRMLTRSFRWMRRLSAAIYDGYLKANGVEAGVDDYNLFVRLLLGTGML